MPRGTKLVVVHVVAYQIFCWERLPQFIIEEVSRKARNGGSKEISERDYDGDRNGTPGDFRNKRQVKARTEGSSKGEYPAENNQPR
jgi:hypothetical protein